MGLFDGLENITNSTLFLMRGIGVKNADANAVGFINAYIDDKDHEPHYKNAVYLLFKPEDMAEFNFFLQSEQERTPLIVEDYDYEGGYVVVVYMFPDQFLREYENFLQGKYSLFRQSYTKLFPEEVMSKGKYGISSVKTRSIYYHVFNRTNDLKEKWEEKIGEELDEDMEYWSVPDREKETLDISKIRKSEPENTVE